MPKITRVNKKKRKKGSEEFRFPEKCPVCGGDVAVTKGEAIPRCLNDECPKKIEKALFHFVSKNAMNVEGLGKEFIKTLSEKGLVKDFPDLYKLKDEDFFQFERMGERLKDKLKEAIEASKETTLSRFLYALGVRYVGEETANLLAKKFKSIESIMNVSYDAVYNIDSIGEESAKSIYAYFSDSENQARIKELLRLGVTPKYEEKESVASPLSGKNVVITGSIEGFTRRQAKEASERLGANVQSAVSKNTDVLIAGEKAGSKLKKAKDFGVEIISASDFVNMYNDIFS